MKLFEFHVNEAVPLDTTRAAQPAAPTSVDPKAVAGATSVNRAIGVGAGASVAKAADQLGHGKGITGNLAKALDPYADVLSDIFANPTYRNQFIRLVKMIKADKAKAGETVESVNEDQDSVDAVAGAITRRIMMQHTDLLSKYGPAKVMAAIDDIADFAGSDGLEEIGSSDVSIWTKQVIADLEAGHFDHVDEASTYEKNKQWIEVTSLLGHRRKIPVHPSRAYAALNHYRNLQSTKSAKIVSEEDNVEDSGDVVDTVTMDVPLMIRMMEYAREDAKDDMDLHDVAERMIAMSKDGPLSMDDYDNIVGDVKALPAPEAVEESYYTPGPETMPGAVGPQEDTNVSYTQTKRIGDSSVTVSANAKDMEELHHILKLAGVEVKGAPTSEPSVADAAVALEPHMPEEPAEEPCGCDGAEPADLKYSTDKTALIGAIKNKLANYLS